jgi:nitrogenase molybdenum-iron protein alpha/beta subunit
MFGTPCIIEEIPIGYRSTVRFLERVADALGIPAPSSLPESPDTAEAVASFAGRNIAIVSGPTRAVSVTRFLAGYGIAPRLVVVDFDSQVRDKIGGLVHPEGEVLIEPDHDLIVRKLREHSIDLVLGGMLEHPVAKALGIEHVDIMHGGQKTVGFAGENNLVRLCRKKEE